MTSVDSGLEMSNDSNDSNINHESRPIEIRSSSPAVVLSSCSSIENSSAIEAIIGPTSISGSLVFDPPAGMSFCNIKPSCGSEKGYGVLVEEVKQLGVYQSKGLQTKMRRRFKDYPRESFFSEFGFGTSDERKLQTASSTNNEELVEALLNAGVNPNSRDRHMRTPLHLAACRGYSKVVQLLLDKGANPNQKDSLGNTPLHLAACTNHVDVVTVLLKAGTDVSSHDYCGRNPLQLAQSKLKLLQRSSVHDVDSLRVKNEVLSVVEMMYTFLFKKGQDSQAELLTAFQSRLSLSNTKEEVETDVRDLLDSLNCLSLKSETD